MPRIIDNIDLELLPALQDALAVAHRADFWTCHGVTSGTDSSAGWAQALYWASGASVLFLALYRVLARTTSAPRPAAATASPGD